MSRVLARLFPLVLLVAYAQLGSAAPPEKAADAIAVSDPYVRLPAPGQPTTGAFLGIENRSKQGHALVRATSPAAKVVELHTHVEENGVFRMRPVPRIELPAGQATKLAPGGLHIMLIDLVEPLKDGQSVPITLVFEDGSTKEIQAPVRMMAGMHGVRSP